MAPTGKGSKTDAGFLKTTSNLNEETTDTQADGTSKISPTGSSNPTGSKTDAG